MIRAVAVIVVLAACADSEPAVATHVIGGLEYQLPAGWQSKDFSERGRTILTWTPEENARKESITLIRSEPLPAMSKANPAVLMHHLLEAQRGLDGAFSEPRELATKHGIKGVRVSGSFTPRGARSPYQRVHALVRDGSSLVHVLYTAHDPDSSEAVLHGVLDSLQRKGV